MHHPLPRVPARCLTGLSLLLSVLFTVAATMAAEPVSQGETPRSALQTPATTPSPSASQVWLVSTRRASACAPACGSEDRIDYWQLEDDCRFSPRTQAEFLAAQTPDIPTIFYVHGNRVDSQQAVCDGWTARRVVKSTAGERPVRLVIWSWPADRVQGGNRCDAQVKAARSDAQSYYLAWCLSQVNPNTRVGLMGYSFGARVITGALHLLGGGCVAGQTLPQAAARVVPLRAVLVASAFDCDWLLPGHRNGLALSQVDRMLITVNGADPALRFYPRMYGRGGPQAAGYVGAATCPSSDEQQGKVELLNLQCQVGKNHDWNCYAAAWSLVQRMGAYVYLPDEI